MKTNLSFAAISPYINENRVLPVEKEIRGQEFISWGEDNKYPFYLYDLYSNVSTLKALIDTTTDYIIGDDVDCDSIYATQDDMSELLRDIAKSYAIYGGFALNVLRNRLGEVSKIVCLDFRKIRSSKEGDKLFYSEDFNNKSYGRGKYIEYPAYDADSKVYSSIYYYKNDKYSVYPTPMYGAAIDACEIEKSINEYHLNNINNGFVGSVVVSLNNGVPDDEAKAEIEKNFNEKFTGKENAGRVVIAYNEDKEHEVTIQKIDTEDFSDRYAALAERSQQQLFTAFRCTPTLVGISEDSKGFDRTQYLDQYELFSKTVIKPIQTLIVRKLSDILKCNIKITPFKLVFSDGDTTNKNIE